METSKKKLLFLCTGNSCRSQMAEALVNQLFADHAEAHSAGTHPRPVHPLAVAVMQELGVDISQQSSKPVETFSGETFDLFITLCDRARENCPLTFEGQRRLHVGFADPADKVGTTEELLAEFRVVRDAILMWLGDFFELFADDFPLAAPTDRHPATQSKRREPMKKKRALFLCTHNACRSQMAEGLVNDDFGDRIEAFSAGTEATRVHPLAAKVMAEIGIDLGGHRSKTLDEFAGQPFDYVITLCGDANERCPLFFGGVKRLHIGFEDPSRLPGSAEEVLPEFRRVRDEIRQRLREFFEKELGKS